MGFWSDLLGRGDPPPLPPAPLTDEEEWAQWRSFIGSKRTCELCGLVMGDRLRHEEWHRP